MDFDPLLENRSEAICKQGEGESHILIESLFGLGVSWLWNVSMEDKVEWVRVDADLVRNHISLVVEEIFKKLTSFTFVVSLSD